MTTRTFRRVAMALVLAGTIAGAVYFAMRPACDADAAAHRGDAKRGANGTLLYFDGRCWTGEPPPAEDQPF